jgi:uncharacterized protein Usg
MDLWLPDSFQQNRDLGVKDRDPTACARRKRQAMAKQLSGHHLTTAEILYALPDHPLLLQTYIWQDYDLAPRFPVLQKFLNFWQRDIEGRLHRVTVSVREALKGSPRAANFTFYAAEFGVEG